MVFLAVHIYLGCASFAGAHLPQHLLFWDQTWWGKHTWGAPSGNTFNNIHDHPRSQAIWGQIVIKLIFMQDLP